MQMAKNEHNTNSRSSTILLHSFTTFQAVIWKMAATSNSALRRHGVQSACTKVLPNIPISRYTTTLTAHVLVRTKNCISTMTSAPPVPNLLRGYLEGDILSVKFCWGGVLSGKGGRVYPWWVRQRHQKVTICRHRHANRQRVETITERLEPQVTRTKIKCLTYTGPKCTQIKQTVHCFV